MFNELRFAISFLTLLPLAPKKALEEAKIANSISFFSLVGLIFSAFTALMIYLNSFFHNHWVMAILIIVSHALLSGGLHLDALMDSHDGLACSDRPREKILEVMKDSRAGAFAVIGLFITLSAQLIFISQAFYELDLYLYLLALAPVLSRFFLVFELVFFVKQSEEKSSLKTFASANKLRAMILNLAVLLVLIYIYPLTKICITVFVLIAFVFSFFLYRFLNYKLKGQNGDSMGCGLVINEAFIYFLIFVFSAL